VSIDDPEPGLFEIIPVYCRTERHLQWAALSAPLECIRCGVCSPGMDWIWGNRKYGELVRAPASIEAAYQLGGWQAAQDLWAEIKDVVESLPTV